MIRRISATVLLATSLSVFAEKASLDMLPGAVDLEHRQLVFTTDAIPNKAEVVVHCHISLPWYYYSQEGEYIYVVPQSGNFGQIENTYAVETYSWFSDISNIDILHEFTDSKISPHPDNTSFSFSITQVKKTNQAILIDLSHIPYETTTNCWF
ncbi:MAG: hypothetical protein P1U36_08845 [Legionellaceae bacterium]|nr:hypothetical protein [Legionellaceae bacterium]